MQRQVCVAASGALKSTSNEALFSILGISPTEETFKCMAALEALRLRSIGNWSWRNYGHASILFDHGFNLNSRNNCLIPTSKFDNRFKVTIPAKELWLSQPPVDGFDLKIFTDGSKSQAGCGSGYFVVETGMEELLNYPTTALPPSVRSFQFVLSMGYSGLRIAIYSDSQLSISSLLIKSILYPVTGLGRRTLQHPVAVGSRSKCCSWK